MLGPMPAEAQTAHLHDEPRQFPGGPVGAPVGVDVEPAALFYMVEFVLAQAVPLGGEIGALRGGPQHLG